MRQQVAKCGTIWRNCTRTSFKEYMNVIIQYILDGALFFSTKPWIVWSAVRSLCHCLYIKVSPRIISLDSVP